MSREALVKVARGAGIAAAGAALTYLAEAIPGLDFGQYTPIIVAAFSVFVNLVRKYLNA